MNKEVKRIDDFRFLTFAGLLLLGGVFKSWEFALQKGGVWWIVFLFVVVASLVVGERIKRNLELIVHQSREQKKKRNFHTCDQ